VLATRPGYRLGDWAVASILGPRGRSPSKKYRGESVFSPPQCFSLSVVTYTQVISIVNFEVSCCTKFQIFPGDPAGGSLQQCSAPPDSLVGGEGARCPLPKNPTPALVRPPPRGKKLPPQNKFGLTPLRLGEPTTLPIPHTPLAGEGPSLPSPSTPSES